jgi:hypothetical protein
MLGRLLPPIMGRSVGMEDSGRAFADNTVKVGMKEIHGT